LNVLNYIYRMDLFHRGCDEIRNNECVTFTSQQIDLQVGLHVYEATPNKILVAFVSPLEKENQRLVVDSEEIVLEYNKYIMINPKRTSEFTIFTDKAFIINFIWGNLLKK
jgi:hypothetical protein